MNPDAQGAPSQQNLPPAGEGGAEGTPPGGPGLRQAIYRALVPRAWRRVLTKRRILVAAAALLLLGILLVWLNAGAIGDFFGRLWEILKDKEAFRQRMESYGAWAPVVFILVQICQVLFSPIPGELTGAAGGYIFGWYGAALYSTIGLALGSWINFFVARFLGKRFVEKLLPPSLLDRIAFLMERQGMIASLIFFIFPGFPKDYYCYALGLTPINWRIFMVISAAGRIPSTLILSIQGSLVYSHNYLAFAALTLLSLLLILPIIIWREKIYRLLYRLDRSRGPVEATSTNEECDITET